MATLLVAEQARIDIEINQLGTPRQCHFQKEQTSIRGIRGSSQWQTTLIHNFTFILLLILERDGKSILIEQSHNGIFVKDIVLMKIDTNELKQ